jgi:hypothetical protein
VLHIQLLAAKSTLAAKLYLIQAVLLCLRSGVAAIHFVITFRLAYQQLFCTTANCSQNFIKRCGAYICSLSWEAYVKQGRGAVYANYDGGKAAGTLSEAEEKLGGIPCTSCTHFYNITKLLLHIRSRSCITS